MEGVTAPVAPLPHVLSASLPLFSVSPLFPIAFSLPSFSLPLPSPLFSLPMHPSSLPLLLRGPQGTSILSPACSAPVLQQRAGLAQAACH